MRILKLPGLRFGHTINSYLELSSTQDKAKELTHTGITDGVVVIARTQNYGRGRGGSIWISEPGGLYFSLIYYPPQPIIQIPEFTKSLAYYTKHAIEKVVSPICYINLEIRGINDLFLNNKKIAGIVVETESYGLSESPKHNENNSYIIGIGVDVNQKSFPIELKETASSLLIETKCRFSRFQIMKAICEELCERVNTNNTNRRISRI